MRDFGIVCEFNPFHRGHQYLLDEARRLGADRIVCVMSGNTLQRGEFSVADAYLRAEAAVRCGADLVLELPFPWCSSGAERFALGGVSILRHVADTLIFGSECGDIDRLRRAAEIADDESVRATYRTALSEGAPAVESYLSLLAAHGAGELYSNDLLGLEYLRAARALGAELDFVTVKRRGAGYTQAELSSTDELPSAMAIRGLWREGRDDEADGYLPDAAAECFRRARVGGDWISEEALDRVALSYLRLCDENTLSRVVGAESGLVNRICREAQTACSLSELLERVRTKRYTDARLRRQILYCLCGVEEAHLRELPVYTKVLAANRRGRELLGEQRKKDGILMVTKPADAPADAPQTILTRRLDAILSLSMNPPCSVSRRYEQRPYLEDSFSKNS